MKVPVYNTQVNLDTPNVPVPPNPGANRAAFGGQVYEANANLGKVGTDIAGALQKHAENQRKIQNDSLIAQADTNYRMAMQDRTLSNDQEDYEVNGQKYQRPIGLLNRQLDSAAGSTEEFDKWHNEQLNSVLKQFPDQQSRDRLVNSLNNHYFTMRDNVIGHEAKQQRAGNVARLEGNIGQKMRDSVVAQDPISLSQALDEVGLTQEELNNANGFDRATSDLNIAKTTGKLAETSVLSSLDTDPTGAKATLLLDSVKNKLDPAAYKEISDNVKKSSKKLLEDAKYNAKQAKYINEAKLLFDFSEGKLGNMNVSQLNDLANSGKVRNEFATAAIRAIQRPINAYEDDDMTFVERANGIFESKNPEQTNAALLDVLDGFSSGNLGQDKMTLLIQSAKRIGEAKAPAYRDNFKRIYDWGTEAGLRVDYKSELTQDFLKGINAGDDPAKAADVAINNAIQKQSVGSTKEKDLNNDVISSFDYISSDDRRKKIVGMKDLDAGLYQYLLKSGLSPDDASKKSYDIISSAGTPDNSFEYIKKITDSMDREIPGWRATSSPVKDYLLKKEEQLNPTRTFNIVKEGMKMSWEQLRQHPFKTPFEAGARYPKAVMKFLEQVQLGDKIDIGKTGQGVFAPNDPDHRGTVEIAQDIGSRIIPEPVIKDPNDRFEYYGKVAEQFMYYLPFSTAGVLTEFGLDPAIKLSFDGLGSILKIPAVAKIMGKEFKGPEWFDSMVKNAVNRFHSPFAKTAEEVKIIREKQINDLTDIINDKMADKMPEIKKAYEKSYGTEPTQEDIKGLIKKKLIDEGVYDKPIEDVAKAINKVKKSGIKFTDVADVNARQPGSIVIDHATGKPMEITPAEAAKTKIDTMNQLEASRKAAVEAGNKPDQVSHIDGLIEKNAKSTVEQGGGKFKYIDRQGEKPAVAFDTPGGGTVQLPLNNLTPEAVSARVKEFEAAGGRKKPTSLQDINARDAAMTELDKIGQFTGDKQINAFGEKYKNVPEIKDAIEKQQKLLLARGEELRSIENRTDAQDAELLKIGQQAQHYREALQGITKAQEGSGAKGTETSGWMTDVKNANENAQKLFGKEFAKLNKTQKQQVMSIAEKQRTIRKATNEKSKGKEGLQEVKLKPGPDTANAGKATSGKIIKHFTKSENIQSILKEGFNTSKPPIHGTGGLQGGPRTGKSGKDVLYFTADDARWKDAVVYVGEGKGNISRDAYDYENQKWVKENNAYKKVSLEPIEASIKENAKILTIDSLKGAKDFLGSKFDKYEMINNLVDKARADGYDVLNLKNPGGKKWDDTTPNKMGNLNRYDELTGGSGKDDFFIINREIIDIKNPSKPAKKGLSSESGQTILPGVGAAGEALGKALEPSNLEGLYQKAINRFQSIENAVDKAKALGADIKPGEDAGLSATRYLSISNQADAVLRDGPFKITKEGKVEVVGEGLQKILTDYEKLTPEKNIESRRQDLKDYLIAKRTIEDLQRPRNESSDENIVSPEQVAAAKKSLDNLTNKYGTGLNLFEDTANRLYDYQKNVLHTLVDNGLMSQEMFDRVLEKNPHYIPFDRVLPTEAQAGAMPTAKQPFSGVKSPVKSIKGSELEIHDVIDSVVKNTYRIMDRAARNKVFVDVHSMMKYPELGIKAVHADMRPIKLSEAETGGDEQTIFRPSPFKPKGNVVEGYIDGKRKYLEVSENMYKAMTGMDEVSSGIIVKLLSQPASWLRTGATITPEFIMRNPIRDQWTALIQTHVGFRPFIDPAGAVADILGKSAIYNEWIRSGGSYASFVELSRPQLKKMSDEIMGNPSILSKLNILNTLQGISQLMEQATRLGVYKAGIRSGLSPVEAGKQSRESTLDFGRRGTSTKEINSVIAFFNAGIQSLDKTARLAKEDPGGMTMKALAAITIPSLLLYLKNRQDPDYKEIPRWQRDLFWMTKIGNTWVRVPKPFLYGQVFGSIPERFFEYVESKDPQAFNKLGDSLYNALSPVAGDPISGLLPTGVKPLVENETNWSFFRGRPIVPVSKQRLIPSEQTSDYDTETSKVLGKILNVSPSKIENLVSGYFGGSGRYVMQGGELLLNEVKKLRGEEIKKKLTTPSDIPLVKGFVAREPISGQAESVQKFYDTKNNINKLQATYHSYLKNGQNEKANDFLAKYPELKYSKEFDSVSKQIGKLSEQIDLVTQSKTMQESEKRKEIERLNRIKLDLAINANKRFSSGK